jgi:hypothetical protein
LNAVMKGFFELQTPGDLLRKLRSDLEDLKKAPRNSYAAFNFFVTAEHMMEWQLPGYENREKRKALHDSSIVLQICSHVANGAKHFVAQAKKHKSVSDTQRRGGHWASNYWASNFWAANYWSKGGLFVELQGEAANELGLQISVVALAERVLDFWEKRPELQGS